MENQEKIEAYLAGELTGKALEQFEAALQADPSLATEVAIQRDMSQYLSSSPKDALRASLANLGASYEVEPSGFNWNKWLPIIGLVGLTGACIWYGFNLKNANYSVPELVIPATQPKTEATTPIIQDTLELIETPIPTPPSKAQQKPKPKKQPQFLPPPPKLEPKKPNKAIAAADFTPNPALEAFINNQVRSGDFDFEIAEVVDTKLIDTKASIAYQGTLSTDEDLSDYTFTVHLFSNKVTDYENFQSIKSWDIEFTDSSEALVSFKINESLKLPAGRYYFYLEDADSGVIHDVQTLKVE